MIASCDALALRFFDYRFDTSGLDIDVWPSRATIVNWMNQLRDVCLRFTQSKRNKVGSCAAFWKVDRVLIGPKQEANSQSCTIYTRTDAFTFVALSAFCFICLFNWPTTHWGFVWLTICHLTKRNDTINREIGVVHNLLVSIRCQVAAECIRLHRRLDKLMAQLSARKQNNDFRFAVRMAKQKWIDVATKMAWSFRAINEASRSQSFEFNIITLRSHF